MKTATRAILLVLVSVVALFTFAEDGAKQYVCPMNDSNQVFSEPGNCPVCGMPLVDKATLKETARTGTNVAILLFNGVQIIDYTGPFEVFGQAKFNVYTVSEKSGPVVTTMNMSINPTYTFDNAPQPDILLIPGGNVDDENPKILDWIRKTSADSKYVLSVCNGAFYLARAGMLDGLSATTFHLLINQLAQIAPKTKVVRDQRYVDNGKIITSAGLSSGIDASLYLVSKIYDLQRAKEIALHMEYNWNPDGPFVRAAMADRYLDLMNLDLKGVEDWKQVTNYGDMDHWEIKGTCKSQRSQSEILKMVQDAIQKQTSWKMESTDGTSKTSWSFAGEKKQPWTGTLQVESGAPQQYTLTMKIART